MIEASETGVRYPVNEEEEDEAQQLGPFETVAEAIAGGVPAECFAGEGAPGMFDLSTEGNFNYGLESTTVDGGDGRDGLHVAELPYQEGDDHRIMHNARILRRVTLTDGQGGVIHALLVRPWWSADKLYAVALDRSRTVFVAWRVK